MSNVGIDSDGDIPTCHSVGARSTKSLTPSVHSAFTPVLYTGRDDAQVIITAPSTHLSDTQVQAGRDNAQVIITAQHTCVIHR